MDLGAAKAALQRPSLQKESVSANQLEFVNLMVDHLTEHELRADPASTMSARLPI